MATRLLPALLSTGLFLSRGQVAPVFTRALSTPTLTLNAVPYGAIIEHCTVPGVVALTFDDGPYVYTSHILDLLDQYSAKATFFINGDNWSKDVDNPSEPWPGLLMRMVSSGHQIGSHTWSHADLTFVSSDTRQYQVRELERVLGNVLGKVPTYLRPPYGSCSSGCLDEMERMGYHVVNFDVDTKDYLHNQPGDIEFSKQTFSAALDAGGQGGSFLVLCHDVLQQTAEVLVPYMLETIRQRGYRAVTVGDCLGDPAGKWYRPSSNATLSLAASWNQTTSDATTRRHDERRENRRLGPYWSPSGSA